MSLTIRIILVFLTIALALLGALYVFDAISLDSLKDSAAKLALLSGIAVFASGIITFVMSGDDVTKKK